MEVNLSMDAINAEDFPDLNAFLKKQENEEIELVNKDEIKSPSSEEDLLDLDEKVEDIKSKEEIGSEEDEQINEEKETSSNFYSVLTKTLKEGGLLSNIDLEDKKIKTMEDFLEVVGEELETREFSDLNENQKYYLKALREGVPEQQIQQTLKVDETLNSITDEDIEEDADLRKNIIYQYLSLKGFDEDEIKNQIKRSVEIGDDVDDAKKYKSKLSAYVDKTKEEDIKQAKLAKQDAIEAQKKDFEVLKTTIDNTKEIIPGFPIDNKMKKLIHDSILKSEKEVDGRKYNKLFSYINSNPIDSQIKLTYLYEITDGFKNMEKLVTGKIKTKAIKDLETSLKDSARFENFGIERDLDTSYGLKDLNKLKIVLD